MPVGILVDWMALCFAPVVGQANAESAMTAEYTDPCTLEWPRPTPRLVVVCVSTCWEVADTLGTGICCDKLLLPGALEEACVAGQ